MKRVNMLAQVMAEIEKNLPSLGAWQGKGLAVLVFGLRAGGKAQLSQIAEGVPDEGSYNTVRQRIKRWISNPRIGWRRVNEDWIGWVWRSYGGRSCWWMRPSWVTVLG